VTDATTSFRPPSCEQLEEHLQRCQPRRTVNPRQILWMVIAAMMAIWLLAGDNVLVMMLPWLMLLGVMVYFAVRVRRQQALDQQVRRINEQAMLRHTADALRGAWQLLPQLTTHPQAHGQTVSIMAGTFLHAQAYEQTIVVCDYLLPHVPPDHPARHFLRLQRVLALLHLDRLADADDALRKLHKADLGSTESAMLDIAQLYQQIKTHHYDDAVHESGHMIERLRPLGVDAGFGYAMLACAYQHVDEPEFAEKWWARATMLLRPGVIFHAIPELKGLTALPASPSLDEVLTRSEARDG